ncbi:MAG TPA: hypothetical protein VGJ48_23665 [Pyrinomonadaceae bacterium]
MKSHGQTNIVKGLLRKHSSMSLDRALGAWSLSLSIVVIVISVLVVLPQSSG